MIRLEMIIITQRELEIINIIKQNPLVSQQEIASILNITRSSVAVHITNLIKKGVIRGRGYFIDEREYVSIIGGANMDIVGHPFTKLRSGDSNPGEVTLSLGGVGRNIAENLSRLGANTKLFSIVGNDIHGETIIRESELAGIDMSHVKRISEKATGTYVAILNEKHDMEVAIAAMDIYNDINEDYLEENKQIIDKSQIIIFDTNLNENAFKYGVRMFRDKKLYLDTVSATKAMRAKEVIGLFDTIKPNRLEAEALSGIAIKDLKDLDLASKYFHKEGVRNVVITLGEQGVYYSNQEESGIMKSKKITPLNATGAGDAFQAALAYAELHGMEIKEKIKFSMGASLLAMDSQSTINKEISVEHIKNIMNDMEEENVK